MSKYRFNIVSADGCCDKGMDCEIKTVVDGDGDVLIKGESSNNSMNLIVIKADGGSIVVWTGSTFKKIGKLKGFGGDLRVDLDDE